MAEGKDAKKKGISRRDFIKGTGLAVGGVAISSTVLGVACRPPAEDTTVDPGQNKTTGAPTQPAVTPPTPTAQIVQVAENTNFTLNGSPVAVKVKDWWTLNYVLRESLGMTGPVKYACDEGICGMCTVIMDGKAVLSCMILAVECEGKSITTVDGLRDKTGKLHAVQQGFIDESGFMCGLCTTGQIMAAKAFLDKNPSPTLDDVRLALSNNLCLCGGYELIQKSVLKAATLLRGG